MRLRVVWPIVNPAVGTSQIISEFMSDLPLIAAQNKVKVRGVPEVRIALSAHTPGSLNVSTYCLVVEVDAKPIKRAAVNLASTERSRLPHNPESDNESDILAVLYAAQHGKRPTVQLTPAAKGEVVRMWLRQGRSAADLAAITGWKPERYHKQQAGAA